MYFRHSKSEQKIPTSRTPLNSFLFNKLYQLKSSADHRGLKNQSFCYAKIIKSLTKYPLPLFSISQAIELEGVGDKTALIIFKILKKHYEQYIKTGNALYPSSQMINADSNSFFSQGGLEEIKIDLNQDFEASNEIITGPELFEEFKVSLNKRSHEDVFDNVKDLEHLKKKLLIEKDSTKPTSKYKLPDPGSVPASVLMSLLAFQSRQSGKYSSKKEIKKVSEEMTVKCAEINNWNCIKTLLKHDIIYKYSNLINLTHIFIELFYFCLKL